MKPRLHSHVFTLTKKEGVMSGSNNALMIILNLSPRRKPSAKPRHHSDDNASRRMDSEKPMKTLLEQGSESSELSMERMDHDQSREPSVKPSHHSPKGHSTTKSGCKLGRDFNIRLKEAGVEKLRMLKQRSSPLPNFKAKL